MVNNNAEAAECDEQFIIGIGVQLKGTSASLTIVKKEYTEEDKRTALGDWIRRDLLQRIADVVFTMYASRLHAMAGGETSKAKLDWLVEEVEKLQQKRGEN